MRPGGRCERIDNSSLIKTRTIEVIIADNLQVIKATRSFEFQKNEQKDKIY
jgi:hypothetical protein